MSELCDYQLWKAALLVKPTRTILYDIALSLGASSVTIEIVEANLHRCYIDTLTVEEFHQFCLLDLLVQLPNKESETFHLKLIPTLYKHLGRSVEHIL